MQLSSTVVAARCEEWRIRAPARAPPAVFLKHHSAGVPTCVDGECSISGRSAFLGRLPPTWLPEVIARQSQTPRHLS